VGDPKSLFGQMVGPPDTIFNVLTPQLGNTSQKRPIVIYDTPSTADATAKWQHLGDGRPPFFTDSHHHSTRCEFGAVGLTPATYIDPLAQKLAAAHSQDRIPHRSVYDDSGTMLG